MTKRCGNHQVVNGKRPKFDDDEEWADELDADALDKCFELATQVCSDAPTSTQANNVSVLPSYKAFKNPSAFTSSTQANINNASTSKISLHELECEIRRLKQQNAEKEGEISILRSRIRETNNCVQVEQQKTTNEWREKLHISEKEVKSVRSDLEFKNLEIANLKQQLAELRRVNLDSTFNNTQTLLPRTVVIKDERISLPKEVSQRELLHKEAVLEPTYPLKAISARSFVDQNNEKHTIHNNSIKISRNTIPYLQNQQNCHEAEIHHRCPRLGNKKISLENIYPDIFKLVNTNLENLMNQSCTEEINKIICVTLILLKDLDDYLEKYGSQLRTENIQQADVDYLLNKEPCKSNERFQSLQLGDSVSKIIDVISRLVTCNKYAAYFICHDKPLKLSPGVKDYAKLIPQRKGCILNDYYLLRLLLSIVSNIGKYRLSEQTNNFLVSVTNMLESIALLDDMNHMDPFTESNEIFCKLFKEIIFVRPGHEVIKRITFLLKICSRHKSFVQYLFKKNGNNELLKAGPKGVLYFNQDVCSFCVLAILLQNYALKTEKIPLEVCYNMLSFIYNTFKISHWIHHESDENVCVCLSQLYKLEIDFVFRGITDFVKCYGSRRNDSISKEWESFLKHEIIQKVLNEMNFNNFELTEKYVVIYAQFKEIEQTLISKGLLNGVQFNVSEELVKIPSKSFNKDF